MEIIRDWFRRHFSDPQVVLLALLLLAGLLGIVFFGRMLAPVIASLVIAYVLDAPAETLRRRGVPNRAAVVLVFLSFLTVIAFAMLAVLPLLSEQLTRLVVLLPKMVARVQEELLTLPDRYPELIDRAQILELTSRLQRDLLLLGQNLLLLSFDRIGNLITVVLYLFVVPFMVFFFLKDKTRILAWFGRFIPEDRTLVASVWREVDHKTGAFVRGKIYEVGIVGAATWLVFSLLHLDFAMLLAALTGLSVLVPYVGVAVVSLPVALVAFFQFGMGGELAAVVGAYVVIQTLDGNLLAPLLISEVVDIHPIAVIASILIFGCIWGFWGVFFAIPLATLAVAVLNAWPARNETTPPAPSPAD
jgi:putative permease